MQQYKYLLECQLQNFRRVFPYLFIEEFDSDCPNILYIHKLGFKVSIETSNEFDFNNKMIKTQHKFRFNTKISFDEVSHLTGSLHKDYLTKSLGVFFDIKETIENDYCSFGDISYTVNFEENKNSIKINTVYTIDCSDYKISLFARNNSNIEVFISDQLKNFKKIEIAFKPNDNIKDLFTAIAKKMTETMDVYTIEDDMTSADLYEFLKINANDISLLNSMIKY